MLDCLQAQCNSNLDISYIMPDIKSVNLWQLPHPSNARIVCYFYRQSIRESIPEILTF